MSHKRHHKINVWRSKRKVTESRLYVSSSIQFGTDVFFSLFRLLDFGGDIYLRNDKWGKLLTRFSLRRSPSTRL